MVFSQCVFKLNGVVQYYAWGGYHFLPELLGLENQQHRPFAEYWLGAHPSHPAVLQKDHNINLAELIRKDPVAVLGAPTAKRFSSLPYLFKLLDVRQMLSIQVHPDKHSAEKKFEEENKKRIPINAANRNYKDANHKPELMVALSDFWLLHGFKKEDQLLRTIEIIPELRFLNPVFEAKNYKGLYEEVMLMPQEKVNEILHPLLQRILPLYKKNALEKSDENFWAARAAIDFCEGGNYDRGIFSIYFFNLLHLKKGEGIFQPAGMPHAYLEGQNAEVMANSDNVLRAGLTAKYIDVPELMKHVDFSATIPDVLRDDGTKGHRIFRSPAREFELHAYELRDGEQTTILAKTAEILFLVTGSLKIRADADEMEMHKGDSVFAVAGTEISISALSGISLFRVSVPD